MLKIPMLASMRFNKPNNASNIKISNIGLLLILASLTTFCKCAVEDEKQSYNINCNINLNEFLFGDNQQFDFVDLTLNLKNQYTKLSDADKSTLRQRYKYNHSGLTDVSDDELVTGTSLSASVYHTEKHDSNDHHSELPLTKLVLPLIIADISDQVNGDPNFILQKHHLDYMLNNYFGRTEQPCVVVFKFGWTEQTYDERKYFGFGNLHAATVNATLSFPGISAEVAKWITTYKNIVGVGVDLPFVDSGSDPSHTSHDILVGAGLYVIENVNLDRYLPDSSCTALILPELKSSPRLSLRFLAICPKNRMEKHHVPFHRL